MHLTHPDAWHCYAGGTCARDDRYGYSALTTIGKYSIWPVSWPDNANRHRGYSVMFQNDKSMVGVGLHQELNSGKLTTLPKARRICRTHAEIHGGTLIPEQLPKV